MVHFRAGSITKVSRGNCVVRKSDRSLLTARSGRGYVWPLACASSRVARRCVYTRNAIGEVRMRSANMAIKIQETMAVEFMVE